MYYFCFDTETNDKPILLPSKKLSFDHIKLLQIAYKKYDDEFTCIGEYNQYVNLIDYNDFKINEINKITIETLKTGARITKILKLINKILSNVKLIIAHNAEFDINVLKMEASRYNYTELINKLNNIPIFCTMINGGCWGLKCISKPMPKLQDLYNHFYSGININCNQDNNTDVYETSHEAYDDVEHCWLCFVKLKDNWKNIILNIGQYKNKNKTYEVMLRNKSYCNWCLNLNYSNKLLFNFIQFVKFNEFM